MNFLDGTIVAVNGGEMTVSLSAFDAPGLIASGGGGSGGVAGQKVSVGIRPEHSPRRAPAVRSLTARAQVVEQLGGVSFVYAVGTDGHSKITIQQKGHPPHRRRRPDHRRHRSGAALVFDEAGL